KIINLIFILLLLFNYKKYLIVQSFFIPLHIHFFQFPTPQQTQYQSIQHNFDEQKKSFLVRAEPLTHQKEIKETNPELIDKTENIVNNENIGGISEFNNPTIKSEFKLDREQKDEGNTCQLPNIRRPTTEENSFFECIQIPERKDLGFWKIKKCPLNTLFVPSSQICLPDKRNRLRQFIETKSSSKEDNSLFENEKNKKEKYSSTEEVNDCPLNLLKSPTLCENTKSAMHKQYSQKITPNNELITNNCICICIENNTPQYHS
ncbi:hypothetical protein Mgra_00003743, partial [Meloidogyne graminicola]